MGAQAGFSDPRYHKPQPAKPTASPIPKSSVFETIYLLSHSLFMPFKPHLSAAQNLL
jgi:hypothetical protein